jgi:hypothetical protein
MPVDIDISLSPRNIARFRTLLKANRPMAAKALTFTAERAQRDWRAGHSVFKRRNTFIDKGVRLRAATPASLEATVGSIDRFVGRHVKGVDEPKVGRLFIPLYDDVAEVPTHRRVLARLRAMLRTKTKPFWLGADGDRYLARRTKRKGGALEFLAVRRERAEIEPRLDAVGIVERTTNREFGTVYSRLLEKWAAEQGRG